jgi:hypothetical protein
MNTMLGDLYGLPWERKHPCLLGVFARTGKR